MYTGAVASYKEESMKPIFSLTFDPLSPVHCHFTNCILKDSQKALKSNLGNYYPEICTVDENKHELLK